MLLIRMLLKYYSYVVIRVCLNGTEVMAVGMEREGPVQKINGMVNFMRLESSS